MNSKTKALSKLREKMKNWPTVEKSKKYGMKAQMKKTEENREFQHKTGRAWND